MPTVPAQASSRNDRLITIAVCIFLTAIIWIVFGQTLSHDFVNFDDDRYVYENSEVSRGLTLDGFKWVLTHSHASLWHPLTTLSHMADCQVYGLRPAGHHFTNVVLHNLGAVLLFLVFRGMTGCIWRSAFVAAIFAVHPMRVESVAWIAERKDVLSGVFFMLTLGAYLHYSRKPSVGRYVTMSIFLACGLMSKATFVAVPLVLLLLDYWPLDRSQKSEVSLLRQGYGGQGGQPPARKSLRLGKRSEMQIWLSLVAEKIPLLALSAAASMATVFAQTVTMASLEQLPLLPRLKNAAVSVVAYLRQMFWPTDLAVFYPHPHNQLNIWVVLACVALIVVLTLLAIFFRQKHPYVFVGWFWYLILLAPVLGIVQAGLQARADRFTYLPHIGITMLVTWACADLTQQWRLRRIVLIATATFAIAASTVLAYQQTTFWRNSISLWEHALAVTPDNQTAHQNLAAALWSKGRTAEANKHSHAAAIAHARTTLKDYPFDVATHNDLGVLLVQNGDVRGGIEQWKISLQLNPDDGNALNNLAWVLATHPEDTIRDGKRAVELAAKATTLPGGNVPIVLRTLAAAYAEAGDFSKAIETGQRALDLATAQNNTSLRSTLRHEIELYQAHTPYRESPPQ
jgi:tetratricopeptide (TPR) repeat protein